MRPPDILWGGVEEPRKKGERREQKKTLREMKVYIAPTCNRNQKATGRKRDDRMSYWDKTMTTEIIYSVRSVR